MQFVASNDEKDCYIKYINAIYSITSSHSLLFFKINAYRKKMTRMNIYVRSLYIYISLSLHFFYQILSSNRMHHMRVYMMIKREKKNRV